MNRFRVLQTVALAAPVFLISLLVSADVVHLKNGRKIEGQIVSRDARSVVLDNGVQKITLSLSLVDRIEQSDRASGAEDQALAQARKFAKAGLLEQAFEAYRTILSNSALSEETREQARKETRSVMGRALQGLRENYKRLIESGEYERCLNLVEAERLRMASGSFESQVRHNLEAEMRAFLAEACLDRNDFHGALTLLEKSAKVPNLDSPFFDAQFGAVLLHTGEYERAASHMLRAAERYPSDHVVLRHLFLSLALSGKTDEAVERYTAHQSVCTEELWDNKSREMFAKACRRAGLERILKGLDESTLDLYAMGMDHSQIEIPLYDEAIQFYTLAGLPDKVAEMRRLREELRNLKERSAQGILHRESEKQSRMEQIRTADRKKSEEVRAKAAAREAIIPVPRRSSSFGTSSAPAGFT